MGIVVGQHYQHVSVRVGAGVATGLGAKEHYRLYLAAEAGI